MGDKKKLKEKQRDKEKSRERSRDKKKSKKKNKDRAEKYDRHDKKRRHKDSRKKRDRDSSSESESSSSSYSSSGSSSDSSNQMRRKKSKVKKSTAKQKESKDKMSSNNLGSTALPFAVNQPSAVLPPIRGSIAPGIIIAPPAPPPSVNNSALTANKPRNKQYHIFKMFPKLSAGPVNIGRTVYCSKFFSKGFLQNLIIDCCDELQKSTQAEGSKKMASMIRKAKSEIQNNDSTIVSLAQLPDINQFEELKISYKDSIRQIRQRRASREYAFTKKQQNIKSSSDIVDLKMEVQMQFQVQKIKQ